MKIAVIGVGGVGGYFGAKLANAGLDVTLVARGEHLSAIKANGLVVKSIVGDFKVDTIKATDNINEIGYVDLIILGVKAWQIKEIAPQLKSIVNERTTILPLQNGILAAHELSEQINGKNIIGGLCRIISKIESPGVINHFGMNPTILFGEFNNVKTERVLKIKELFDIACISSTVSNNIDSDLWKKFISICLSGLLAVSRTTYGEMRELKETRKLMIDLLNEIYQLSQRIGIEIEDDFLDKTISFTDLLPYDSTSSLTRDVWEGKPSELEYQNGTVVSLGEKHGIDTPVNRFIYNCILPMELKARKHLQENK